MDKDTALDLALEALEGTIALTMAKIDLRNKAITAIKQARSAPVQEPVIPEGFSLVAVKGFDELMYWLDRCERKGHLENCPDLIEPYEAFDYRTIDTTPPAAQRQWVDPNDKTQEQYLPHIGEPVLFCHEGKTYMGKHTGGSFQSEVTNQYFNTWFCHWMYLPAAHGIKENT